MEQNRETNKMGVMPVDKLMLNMGIPMIFSMALQAVYNIVDSAFVSNMKGTGEAALNALTLVIKIIKQYNTSPIGDYLNEDKSHSSLRF